MSNLHRHLLLAILLTLDFFRDLLHRLRTIIRRRKSKNSRWNFRGFHVFSNSNQEDHRVQQALAVALQVEELPHFPPIAPSKLLVELVAFLLLAILLGETSEREKIVTHSRSLRVPASISSQTSALTPATVPSMKSTRVIGSLIPPTVHILPLRLATVLSGGAARTPRVTAPTARSFGVKQIILSNPSHFLLIPRALFLPAMTARVA